MTTILIATADRDAGGIKRALQDQISLLQAHDGLSLTLLAPQQRLGDLCQISPSLSPLVLTDQARMMARYLPKLAPAVITSQRFDIAFCHNGFLAACLSRLARHVIGICHNDKPDQFTGCDHLICLTEDGIAKARQAGWKAERLTLIPHYYEEGDSPLQPAMPKAPLTIGAAGRMVAKKNLSLVIDIAEIVKQTHPAIRFQLGGTGQLFDTISAHNKTKGSPVSLLGWTEFTRFLAAIDIMLIPSLDEPFGYVYPEAMSQGVAILSSDSFGGRHHIGPISPLLPADDAQKWADEICRLNDDLTALSALQQACLAQSRGPAYHKQTAAMAYQKLLGRLS